MTKYRIVERTDDNLKVTFIVQTQIHYRSSAEWKQIANCSSFNAARSYIRSLNFTDKVIYEADKDD